MLVSPVSKWGVLLGQEICNNYFQFRSKIMGQHWSRTFWSTTCSCPFFQLILVTENFLLHLFFHFGKNTIKSAISNFGRKLTPSNRVGSNIPPDYRVYKRSKSKLFSQKDFKLKVKWIDQKKCFISAILMVLLQKDFMQYYFAIHTARSARNVE